MNKSNTDLYRIKSLVCSYKGAKGVIRSDNKQPIVIPKVRLVTILGLSGIGKSTVLEALGVMNATIEKKGMVKLILDDEKELDLHDLWEDSNKDKRIMIRNKYFSFAFQKTNLLSNYTVHENIKIANMIKGESNNHFNSVINDRLKGLEIEGLEDKRVDLLSGGQRQRVGFCRALSTNFNILFGDEPTGDLDPVISDNIMRYFKEIVYANNATAVIVTHDIDLAKKYADYIIIFTGVYKKAEVNGCDIDQLQFGYISSKNAFYNNDEISREKIVELMSEKYYYDEI